MVLSISETIYLSFLARPYKERPINVQLEVEPVGEQFNQRYLASLN